MVSETLTVGEARKQISRILSEVKHQGKRIVVTNHGKPRAALISIEDLELLVKLSKHFKDKLPNPTEYPHAAKAVRKKLEQKVRRRS